MSSARRRRTRRGSTTSAEPQALSDPLADFHPLVRAWFAERFGAPSEPQRLGWPAIACGQHTLILAPTGTGKTLAAFLWELNALIREGQREPLPNAVQMLYVSPLKALGNDIHVNLERPLAELRARFEEAGEPFPEIRVAVRSGDTPANARSRMLRRTPHILITTPESLAILLTTERGRGMLTMVRVVIVDEIHAVAGGKRGVHLALSLERLHALQHATAPALARPGGAQRIGLSATQRPLDEIARFLGGCDAVPASPPRATADPSRAARRTVAHGAPRFRPVTVVDCGLAKRTSLAVISPVPDLARMDGSVWPKVAELVLDQLRGARTTLVFVNNRGQAERMAARLNALAGRDVARPYHGSLARERRLALERALRAGELPALVATSALELGIDIGSVDLVIQVQSPKRVSAGLQRIGRAGHALGAESRGVFVPTFRDDLVETAAIVGAMREGDVEETRVPQNALDVLAQGIVAAVSVDEWDADALFATVRGAYPYHALPRSAFDEVVAMLSGKYASELNAELDPRIAWDRTTGRLSASRAARMMAVISGGTIPDRGLYAVYLPDRTRLGELDEEFVHESRVGDAFQLGSATWRIGAIEHDRVIVTPAPGAPARMPFWHGEYGARAASLGVRVGEIRRAALRVDDLARRAESDVAPSAPRAEVARAEAELARAFGGDEAAVRSLRSYVAEQRAATGVVPDERTVVVEHFRDEMGAVRIVVHSVFGGRVNAPWAMALAQRVAESLGSALVQVQTTDDGIMLRLPELSSSAPVHAVLDLLPDEAERRITEEVGSTSLFGSRFRMNAARALLLPRQNPRRRMPLWLQRLRALDLLDVVRQFPSFPIVVETYREVLNDAFDLPALRDVLARVARGEIAVRVAETDRASPFAASLQFGFVMDWLYADDTPRAERGAAALSLDRAMLAELMQREGADPELTSAIGEAISELVALRAGTVAGRRARSAEELVVLLERAGDLSLAELAARVAEPAAWRRDDPLASLLESGRVVAVRFPGDDNAKWRVIPTELYGQYAAAVWEVGEGVVRAGAALIERSVDEVVPEPFRASMVDPGAARREILSRYVGIAGVVTVREVTRRYGWPKVWVERRLRVWERAGTLVRGRFRGRGASEGRVGEWAGGALPTAAAGDAGDKARADAEAAGAVLDDTGAAVEWCRTRLLEAARRRALAAFRRSVQAVELPRFQLFLQRWQQIDAHARPVRADGGESVVRQLYGVPLPGVAWERDVLPARLAPYDPLLLPRMAGSGELVWVGEGESSEREGRTVLRRVRLLARGEVVPWLSGPSDTPLSKAAEAVRGTLQARGASFLADLQEATALGVVVVRDALRELVAAGLATNDTVEAMREVMRTRALPPREVRSADPTRWRQDGQPTAGGWPVVQRRPSARRLPKWRRPDVGDAAAGWVGRWSLLAPHQPDVADTADAASTEEAHAAVVARQWLERYGVVSRDWWRRDWPAVSWRAIYRELRRMELVGEVRRGYFVRGLAGVQFALSDAVEALRAPLQEGEVHGFVAMAAVDPANVYRLRLPEGVDRPPLSRARGGGAVLVTRAGEVVAVAEGRGRRIRLAPGLDANAVSEAVRVLMAFLRASGGGARRRGLVVEQIDDVPAGISPHAAAFARAGFRRGTRGLVIIS